MARAPRTSTERFFEHFQPILERHAPARIIVDVANVESMTMSARWRLAERMKAQRRWIYRSAVYNVDETRRLVGGVLLRVTGRRNVVFVATRARGAGRTSWTLAEP